MVRKLTNKQKAFISAYCSVSKFNATDAARRAGYKYPDKQGSDLVAKLSDYIASHMEKLQKEVGSDIDSQKDLLKFFSSVRRGQEKESLVTNAGSVVEVPVSMKDRIKAAELLGRSYGMFTDKKEITGSLEIDIGMGDYNEDD